MFTYIIDLTKSSNPFSVINEYISRFLYLNMIIMTTTQHKPTQDQLVIPTITKYSQLEQQVIQLLTWHNIVVFRVYNAICDSRPNFSNHSIIAINNNPDYQDHDRKEVDFWCNSCEEVINPNFQHFFDLHSEEYIELLHELTQLSYRSFEDLPKKLHKIFFNIRRKHLRIKEHWIEYRLLDQNPDNKDDITSGDIANQFISHDLSTSYHCDSHNANFSTLEMADLHIFMQHQQEFNEAMTKFDKLDDIESQLNELVELMVIVQKSIDYHNSQSDTEIDLTQLEELELMEELINSANIDMDKPIQILSLSETGNMHKSIYEKISTILIEMTALADIPIQELDFSEGDDDTVKLNMLLTSEKIFRKLKEM